MKSFYFLVLVFAVGCSSPDPKTNNVANNANNVNNVNNSNNANNSNNGVDYFACTFNDECIKRSVGCCDVCSEETLENSTSVNALQNAAYSESVCAGGGECPACESEPTATILPTCGDGTCNLIDLQMDAATECSVPEDCVLRTNTCCECTDVTRSSLIAIRADSVQNISEWRCGDEVACDDCVPSYEGFEADCSAQGRCIVMDVNF